VGRLQSSKTYWKICLHQLKLKATAMLHQDWTSYFDFRKHPLIYSLLSWKDLVLLKSCMQKEVIEFAFQKVFLSRTRFLFIVLCLSAWYCVLPNTLIYFQCLLKQTSSGILSNFGFCQFLQAPTKFLRSTNCK